jgi:isoleucyl-tRNA synthetase
VFLVEWADALPTLPDDAAMGRDYWGRVQAVRDAVNREMEARRAAGEIRGSLDATVTLYCDDALAADLDALGDELRFVLITSGAGVAALAEAPAGAAETELAGLRVRVEASADDKCERCWHRRPDVGSVAAHPTLCGRCVENVDGAGEQRRFA